MAQKNCWEVEKCPEATRQACPAFKENRGTECWKVTGTLCRGETQGTMAEKIGQCRDCAYYKSVNRVRYSIGVKLAAGFGLVLLLLVTTAAVTLLGLNRTESAYLAVINGEVRAALEADRALVLAQKAAIGVRGYAITGASQEKDNCRQALEQAEKQLAVLEACLEGDELKAVYRDMQAKFKEAKAAMLGLIALKDKSLELAAAGKDNRDAEVAVGEWVKQNGGKISGFLAATEDLNRQLSGRVQAETGRAGINVARTRSAAVLMAGMAILIGTAFAMYITLKIRRPILLLEARSAEIAAGDFTGQDLVVHNRDETGRLAAAFNEMAEVLRDVLKRLVSSSDQLAEAAGQLNAGAQQVASAANDTTTNITQVADGTQHAARMVQQVAEMAREMATHAEKGQVAAERAEKQIRVTGEVTEQIGTVVGSLQVASGQISQIVALITGITDKTNLLALNAAIEAARAGEHGRGFAVVAEEVRKLAGQSSQAAEEIGEIVRGIENEISQVVAAMAAARQEADRSLEVVAEAGGAFREINRRVGEVAEKMQDAAAVVQEISASVENVAAASQEQTATVEELSAAAAGLNELAESLKALAARFRFA
ncbi:HAMP domain-containing protein [Desulfofundulus thermobenzoicus]|uniref:HAMP domain-containing protein n=1 Tax=Desulfofundulus thermobenzoicus TaxID=29376 RepID=A0A6N7INU0_9FIRM|nr:methyl-accepting chemotaxis protein [Desulfofundulus thermobenzoicus]MQL51644.1 HAMP domain-containing protein [Desulfofundulus thermobenzoicus]